MRRLTVSGEMYWWERESGLPDDPDKTNRGCAGWTPADVRSAAPAACEPPASAARQERPGAGGGSAVVLVPPGSSGVAGAKPTAGCGPAGSDAATGARTVGAKPQSAPITASTTSKRMVPS